MYRGVPTVVPARVSGVSRADGVASSETGSGVVSELARATPKSVTRTRPLPSTSTFAGLKSRWTSPASWAARSPRLAWMNASRISCGVRGRSSSHAPRVVPEISSIARTTCSPTTTTSKMFTTLGCDRRAIAWASRRSRTSPVLLFDIGCRSLIATRRSSSGSYAAYTAPMPP